MSFLGLGGKHRSLRFAALLAAAVSMSACNTDWVNRRARDQLTTADIQEINTKLAVARHDYAFALDSINKGVIDTEAQWARVRDAMHAAQVNFNAAGIQVGGDTLRVIADVELLEAWKRRVNGVISCLDNNKYPSYGAFVEAFSEAANGVPEVRDAIQRLHGDLQLHLFHQRVVRLLAEDESKHWTYGALTPKEIEHIQRVHNDARDQFFALERRLKP
jgi:hypothetical protein